MAITAALIGGGAALGSTLLGAALRPQTGGAQAAMSQEQAQIAREQLAAQMAQQGLVNQRAVAGSTDSFGTTVRYDPVTNQWVQVEGALPRAADTAAIQAGITRNTTDLQQQELANAIAMRRATQAGGAADTALRNLEAYRPTSADELTGLLTQQATTAARQTYDPLRADIMRTMARTGSAAGPVLAQLGRSEAENLRNSLVDARMRAITGVDQINQQRRAGLESSAGTTAALATPQLGQTNIQGSNYAQLAQQLASQRAAGAGYTTAAGGGVGNTAMGNLNNAFGSALKYPGDQTSNIDRIVSGIKDIGTSIGPGGGLNKAFVDWLTPKGGTDTSGATGNYFANAGGNYFSNVADPNVNYLQDNSQGAWGR